MVKGIKIYYATCWIIACRGAIYTGIKTYLQTPLETKPEAEKNLGKENSAANSPPSLHSLMVWATQLDENYQTFIQQEIDPWLSGKTRQQQLELLTGESRLPSGNGIGLGEFYYTAQISLLPTIASSLKFIQLTSGLESSTDPMTV